MPSMPALPRSVRRGCLAGVLLLVIAPPAFAHAFYNFASVDERAQKAVANGETPSLVFAIAKDGEIVHEGAFGLADRESGRLATLHTAYPLASATKPLTATALMVLKERGELGLDDSLHTLLPGLEVRGTGADGITLTQLLTHTSGLGTYARIRYGEQIAGAPALLDDLQAHAVTMNAPGRISEYSNLGYGLLGEIVAERAGAGFPEAMQRLVFQPLGMEDAFIDTPRDGQADVAVHYDAALARLPPLRNNTPGAGNAYASATDLIRFAMLHAGGTETPLLSSASVAAMQARHDTAFHHYYGNAHYGLGWYVRDEDKGMRVAWHEGGMPGASTLVKLLPGERIAVVVLGNRTDANALNQGIADALIRVVQPSYRPQPLDPVAGYAPLASQPGFSGLWQGSVRVDDVDVPSTLTLEADGSGKFSYHVPGNAPAESAVRAIVKGDSLIAAVPGRLPSRDIGGNDEPLLLLKLVRTGDHFSGAVVAYSSQERLDYLLPFAIHLQRQAGARQE